MSLIKCPGCNSHVSELEVSCPNCEFPITEEMVQRIRDEERKERAKQLNPKKNYSAMGSWIAYR